MSSFDALYHPAPANVPAAITRLSSAYRLRVLAMVGGLFLFLLLYFIFIAAAGVLAWGLILLPIPNITGKGIFLFLVLKFGGAFSAVLLWLFLLKGLFKGRRVQRSSYVALSEKDYPQLFAFIHRVYRDVGARRPRRVYVSPDVNAALIYDTSLLNLILPPRKDLLIGLGLVNVVNLSEFKAVLAHEFGHFAQRSVGLGSYLYIANRVLHDVIYSRDGLDRFVDSWSSIDWRLSFPAWGLKGVLWIVRKVLAGTYQGLNLLHLSLSRQMEYNADNVAVSVTGSDALINGLYRLKFAQECLVDAAQSLNAAADHDRFSDDLFYHQAASAPRLRRLRKDDHAGLPPEPPPEPTQQIQVFRHVEDGIPDRYRSHPTDYMREQNAKRIYIRSPGDDRPAWLLFGDAIELKSRVTERFYQQAIGRSEKYHSEPAAVVQQFIEAEHAEATFDARYHGFYDDRFLNPGDVKALPKQPWSREELAAWLVGWPAADLPQRLEKLQQLWSEYHLLQGLKAGELTLKAKTFPFRNEQRSPRDVKRLFTQVDLELNAALEEFNQLDRQVFLAHWSLARNLDGGTSDRRESELLERYRFHTAVQALLQGILGERARLNAILNAISGGTQLDAEGFQRLRQMLQDIHASLTQNLEDAQRYQTPELTHVSAGTSLHTLIVDHGDTNLPPLFGDSITGEWLMKLMNRLDGVNSRLRRVNHKSLGSLLACQEKLVGEWQASHATPRESGADSLR